MQWPLDKHKQSISLRLGKRTSWVPYEACLKFKLHGNILLILLLIAEMSKSFWTCQSFGLILKILSVRTIKYAAEILFFCQSEWNFVSQILRSDTFRHHCYCVCWDTELPHTNPKNVLHTSIIPQNKIFSSENPYNGCENFARIFKKFSHFYINFHGTSLRRRKCRVRNRSWRLRFPGKFFDHCRKTGTTSLIKYIRTWGWNWVYFSDHPVSYMNGYHFHFKSRSIGYLFLIKK